MVGMVIGWAYQSNIRQLIGLYFHKCIVNQTISTNWSQYEV